MQTTVTQYFICPSYLTFSELTALERQFIDALSHQRPVCFNFDQTEEVDSAGLQWLMSTISRLEMHGIHYEFSRLSEQIRAAFRLFGMQSWLQTG